MKQNEKGRSALELLSVLVVVILIALGGLHLWNEAKFDAKSRSIGERLLAVKNSRLLSMNSHSNERLSRTESAPYDSVLSIENGIGPQNKDWFWITVKTSDSSLCSFLTEYDIDAGFVNDDCETSNEVTFYFLKFPENASSDTPNKDNQPKECPENMICNDNFEPIGCKENYFLHNGNCTQCPENNSICENGTFECKDGYYKDGIRCRSCGANVLSCDEDGNPTECKVNYYLSGNLCIACPTTGLATCDDDGFTCLDGYYKNGNNCTSCGTGVVTCDEDGNPTECEDGYYLSGNSCVQCPTTGVDTCDTNGFTCLAGYYKNGNTCVFCAQFDQYSIGGSVTACSVCEIGKKANDQHSACVNCQVGEKCACDAGLLWNGTACACPENSSTNVVEGNQIANTVCYCNEGYELNEDKTGCFLDICQNFTPSTCILSCQTKEGVQEYEYATSGTSCKTNSSFGTDNGFCDGQGNCQPNLCETGCSYNYDCNSGEYCSFDPEDYVSNVPQMCSGQCKAVECTEVVNNNAIKTDITYDSAYNFCSALKRNGIVSDYWGYTPAGYTYWFNNGNMGPLSSSQYTGIQIAVSGGGLSSSNAVGYDVRNKKYSVNCPMEMDCPTRVCPENSSITVRNGYQITGSSCYCNEGYELNEDKTGCVEPDPCNGDMCCRSLIDVGLTIDTECNNNVCGYSETSAQKDNTFYMHGTTKPWPFIKGNITLDDNISIPSSCRLTIRGNVTVNSDIELASLDVIEGELLVSENKTLLAETMTSRAKMTVQEGARVEGDILIQNYLVNKGNIKTDDYSGCFVGDYLENSGTMEGCGIGNSTSLPTTTTSQIINTGTLLAKTINMAATDRTATIRNEGILQITEDIRVYNGSILNYGEISTSEVYASYFDNLGKTTVLDSMYLGAHQKGISKIVTSASALSVREGSTLSVKNLYADATNTIVGLSGILNVTGNCELGDNSPQAITTGLSIGTNGSMTVEGGLEISVKSGTALFFNGFNNNGILKVRGGRDSVGNPTFQVGADDGDFAIKMASGEIWTCNGLFSSGNISVSGTASLKNAGSQSIKNWVKNKDGSWEDDYSIYDNTHIVPYGAQIEWCQ